MTMKKILLSCCVLLLHICMFGQTTKNDPRIHSKVPGEKEAFYQEQKNDVINNAEFVFEGVVQRQDIYPRTDKEGTEFCAGSYIIKIIRVFRGHLKSGTVELVTTISPYSVNFEMPIQRKNIGIEPSDSVYLFFCKNAKEDYPYDKKYNIDQVSNKTILTDANNYVHCMTKLPTLELFGYRIPGVETTPDYYKYLCSFPHMDKSVLTKADTSFQVSDHVIFSKTYTKAEVDSARRAGGGSHKKKAQVSPNTGNTKTGSTLKSGIVDTTTQDSLSLIDKARQSSYEYARTKSMEMAANANSNKKQSATRLKAGTATNDFTANILNQTTTTDIDGTAYYEFDVQAAVNNVNLYYAMSSTVIQLPTANFSIATTDVSKVTVTSYSSDYRISTSILASNELSFFHCEIFMDDPFNGIYQYPNRHKINGSELLYHVKIEINACSSSIQLTTNSAEPEYAEYSNTQSTLEDWILYDTFSAPNPTAFTFGCNAVTGIAIDEPNIVVAGSSKTLNMDAGTSFTDFTISLAPSDIATYSSITWSANGATNITYTEAADQLSATVNAVTSGTAKLTATVVSTNGNTYTDNVDITVHPVITSITSSNLADLSAGDGQIITITGKGFGSYVQDNTCVSFASSTDGGIGLNGNPPLILHDYDNYDYTQCTGCIWAEDSIIMFLPAMVTSKSGSTISTLEVGSGNVKVEINTTNTSNPYNLNHINHNYIQTIVTGFTAASGTKYKFKLHDTFGTKSGIFFSLNPSSNFTTDEKNAINLAMANWSCKLPLTIDIDASSANVIKKGTIAEAMLTQPLNPTSFAGINDVYPGQITITIDNTSTTIWNTTLPNSGIAIPAVCNSFYYDILHELGHALMLGHVNIPDDLMYYTSNNSTDLTKPLGDNYALADAQTRVTQSETLKWLTAPTPIPNCPTLPIITGFNGSVISTNAIQLTWLEADPNATITIKRNDGTNTVTLLTTTGSTTFYSDNGVSAGNIYTYTITATNTWITLTTSTIASTTPPVSSPSNSSEETISWPAILGATGYQVKRSTSPNGPFNILPNGNVSAGTTSLKDGTVTPGDTYYYEVITINASGSTSVSQIISATACLSSTGLATTATITGTYSSGTSTTKQAQTITSSGSAIVSSGATLKSEGTQTIGFRPGFSVKSGAIMTAHIIPVCGTLKSALVDSSAIINGKELKTKINIFPNPTRGIITVEVKGESFKFELYNTLGVLIRKDENCNDQKQIDISNFASGTYFLKVLMKDNEQQSYTILKE